MRLKVLFLGLAMLLVVGRWYSRDPEGLVAIPIVAFASLVALFFVAFITQQQVVIWLLLGSAGAAAERLASARREGKRSQLTAGRDRM